MDNPAIIIGSIILGWVLGIGSNIFILNYKDLKMKKKIAFSLSDEIERNTNMIVPILDNIWEDPGNVYEFRCEVYDQLLSQLSILGPILSSKIRSWYDIADIMYKVLKSPGDGNYQAKLRFFHEKHWGEDIENEWKKLQDEGFKIVEELRDISNTRFSWDLILGT